MITDVPTYQELQETADVWLNLALETVIDLLIEKQSYDEYIEDIQYSAAKDEKNEILQKNLQELHKRLGVASVSPTTSPDWDKDTRDQKFWQPEYHKLNLAISLTQQAMELFLKAKIAEKDPFLLITNYDPEKSKGKSFLDCKTLDVTVLIKEANKVTDKPLPLNYNDFFHKLRKKRNKIIHLTGGSFPTEAKAVLTDILEAFKLNYPNTAWSEYRLSFIMKNKINDPLLEDERDFIYTGFLNELDIIIKTLSPASCKKYVNYDKKKEHICCPNCFERYETWETKYPSIDDMPYKFAMHETDQSVTCVACLKTYTKSDYDKKMVKCRDEKW